MRSSAITKRGKKVGLCVIASFAFAAVLVAPAQAKHMNTGPIKFTAVSTSAPSFEPETTVETVKCASGTAAGEITSATSGHLTAVFVGCETEGKKCTSAGASVGTIQTEALATETGYINRVTGEVGTNFKPASGEFYAQFDCPGTPDYYVAIKQSVIGRLEPANTMSTTIESVLNHGEKTAFQEIERFEGTSKQTLLFQVSAKGKAGWERGEFIPNTGGAQNVDWKTSNSEQQETKGTKIKKFPDEAKVITTGTQPEYVRCRKAHAAKWRNSACSERATEKHGKLNGHFELFPVPS
jgi:hypothetical protein